MPNGGHGRPRPGTPLRELDKCIRPRCQCGRDSPLNPSRDPPQAGPGGAVEPRWTHGRWRSSSPGFRRSRVGPPRFGSPTNGFMVMGVGTGRRPCCRATPWTTTGRWQHPGRGLEDHPRHGDRGRHPAPQVATLNLGAHTPRCVTARLRRIEGGRPAAYPLRGSHQHAEVSARPWSDRSCLHCDQQQGVPDAAQQHGCTSTEGPASAALGPRLGSGSVDARGLRHSRTSASGCGRGRRRCAGSRPWSGTAPRCQPARQRSCRP